MALNDLDVTYKQKVELFAAVETPGTSDRIFVISRLQVVKNYHKFTLEIVES